MKIKCPLVGNNRVFYFRKPNQKSINTMERKKKNCNDTSIITFQFFLWVTLCQFKKEKE